MQHEIEVRVDTIIKDRDHNVKSKITARRPWIESTIGYVCRMLNMGLICGPDDGYVAIAIAFKPSVNGHDIADFIAPIEWQQRARDELGKKLRDVDAVLWQEYAAKNGITLDHDIGSDATRVMSIGAATIVM